MKGSQKLPHQTHEEKNMHNKTFDFDGDTSMDRHFLISLGMAVVLAFLATVIYISLTFPANAQFVLNSTETVVEKEPMPSAYEKLGLAAYQRTEAGNRLYDRQITAEEALHRYAKVKEIDEALINQLRALEAALAVVNPDSELAEILKTDITAIKVAIEASTLAVTEAQRADTDAKAAVEIAEEELQAADEHLLMVQNAVMLTMFGHVIDEMTLAAELQHVTELELQDFMETGDAATAERMQYEELILDHCTRNPDNRMCQDGLVKALIENREKHDE